MSALNWRYNAQLFSALPRTTRTIGTFVADNGTGYGLVNFGQSEDPLTGPTSTIPARYATRYRPRPGDGVILEFHGNTVRIVGPTAARSKIGTVTAVAIPRVTVLCDGKSYSLPITVSYQSLPPAVGDIVSIDWDGGFVEDKLTVTPDDADVEPKLSTDQRPFTLTFSPTQSGSFTTATNRWNGTKGDLYCDSTREAAWFYGTKVRRSLKNDAYISSVEIYLSLRTKSGPQPAIGRHYDKSEQHDGVSLNSGAQRGWKGWIRLPTAWAEAWRTDVGGVAISGGKSVYRGIGTDHQSGRLRIRGRQ